jgi:hypothetical protein
MAPDPKGRGKATGPQRIPRPEAANRRNAPAASSSSTVAGPSDPAPSTATPVPRPQSTSATIAASNAGDVSIADSAASARIPPPASDGERLASIRKIKYAPKTVARKSQAARDAAELLAEQRRKQKAAEAKAKERAASRGGFRGNRGARGDRGRGRGGASGFGDNVGGITGASGPFGAGAAFYGRGKC